MGNTRQIVIYFGSYFLPITPKTLCAGFLLNRYNAVKTANKSFFIHMSALKSELIALFASDNVIAFWKHFLKSILFCL